MDYKACISATLGAMTLLAPISASAGSVNQPGFTTGAAVYGDFPENLYLIAIPEYGVRTTTPTTNLNAFTPFFFDQTPYKVGPFNIAAVFSPIILDINQGKFHAAGLYNTYGGVQFTHQFGNGFGAGFRLGGFVAQDNAVAGNFGTFDARFGVTYLKDGTDITINLNPGSPVSHYGRSIQPNYFNIDITATHQFGKLEFGGVAFGSTDLRRLAPGIGPGFQQQFAAGPLIGYQFGPVNVQLKLTTDVAQRNYGGRDRRAWLDILIPLLSPVNPKANP